MYRRWNHGRAIRMMQGTALAGLLSLYAVGAFAQTKTAKTVPDAQVEANVLKALASESDLANQPLTTTTVYGVVTLSGSVQTEAMRTKAETITSRTSGVQKVVDEMTLTADSANGGVQVGDQSGGGVQYSEATMAPPPSAQQQTVPLVQGSQESDNTRVSNQASGPSYGPGAPENRQPYGGRPAPPSDYPQQQGYPQQRRYPQQQQGYPQQQRVYNGASQSPYGGQAEGEIVTIPSGALLRMRISQSLDSSRTQPGSRFDGVVVNDVVADGAVAIPRGATVQGTVLNVQKSGALKGRGELSLQLT